MSVKPESDIYAIEEECLSDGRSPVTRNTVSSQAWIKKNSGWSNERSQIQITVSLNKPSCISFYMHRFIFWTTDDA